MARSAQSIVILLLVSELAVCRGEPPANDREAPRLNSMAQAALREASQLALQQDREENFWTARVLLRIGELQMRAGDFEFALRSIRGSSDSLFGNFRLTDLAAALARNGQQKRAFEVLRLRSDADDSSGGRVRLRWIEYLIERGEFAEAGKAVEALKQELERAEGLRLLASGYAKAGQRDRAAYYFALALNVAASLKDDSERARAFSEIADNELAAGMVEAAKATIGQLTESEKLKDPWATLSALVKTAALAARANQHDTSRRLFASAIEAQNTVHPDNRMNALQWIGTAQASVGYTDDALKTASIIKRNKEDWRHESAHDQTMRAIVVALLKADDLDGARRAASLVNYFEQYRDDACRDVVSYQINKGDLKAALATCGKFENPSRKAAAILAVAAAHAKAGDREQAHAVAATIKLTSHKDVIALAGGFRFDYRLPSTWGELYEGRTFSTMASIQRWREDAAAVASAAMMLSQALGQKPSKSYAILFNEIHAEEVVEALARAHASSGEPAEALAWARQIGSDRRDPVDGRYAWAVERRIHALIGFAEGIMDRDGERPPKP